VANKPETAPIDTAQPRRRPSWWWLLAYGLVWPAALFGISALRFGGLPTADTGLDLWQIVSGGVGFTLLGVVSGWFAIWLARRNDSRAARVGTVLGYVLATPVAFVGGLVGPLSLEVLYQVHIPDWVTYLVLFPLGVLLAGMVPLITGSALGFAIGSAVAGRTPRESTPAPVAAHKQAPKQERTGTSSSGAWHGAKPGSKTKA
jgi:hypothetical protein